MWRIINTTLGPTLEKACIVYSMMLIIQLAKRNDILTHVTSIQAINRQIYNPNVQQPNIHLNEHWLGGSARSYI